MPYRFLEDIAIADVAFEAWGETREELFAASAAALLRTMVELPDAVERRQEQMLRLEHEELDLLLFSFLQELVFLKDARRLLLHADSMRIEEGRGLYNLEATVRGEEIDPRRHSFVVDVKAVTLHRFRVFFENGKWKAVIVLDV
jgi:SHS2 domain-containing protein